MLTAAWLALNEILTPPFRSVLWKSLGLTILLLILAWFGLQALVLHFATWPSQPWIETSVAIVTGFGLVVGLCFLIAPVSALMAGLFSDDIASLVETTHYPFDPPGRGLSFSASLIGTLGFTLTVIAVNLVCLVLLLVPGVNLVAFFIGNGYLLGREFFEAAAARFRSVEEARALRRENAVTVLLGGFVIALFLAIPVVNLLTPLFATAFMTHLHKRLTGSVPVRMSQV
ncbi:sulfate transporter family protein [Kaistia dalseonensis]|uniref:CysZ protein n=1 Tax=Kaistia dalseonensis TaxID=410840 RepID=A0ABU0H5L1_9HYPH|nr:sulfate transporter family protein [Kaistia dalseonensis]MCX5495015.1 sulfate transporter family protein [Kaistia dalseonensis]MDQ0437596.1 CysZ protein [Kaistia dalseonensis]